jgi:hypothetical protein
MQLHSTIISEPVAIGVGLVTGLLSYAVSAVFTVDHQARVWAGMVAAVIVNLLIGAKINLIMLDILGLILVRPISAIASAKLLNDLLGKIGGS